MYTYIYTYIQHGLGEGWHLGWEDDSIGGCLAVYVCTYMHTDTISTVINQYYHDEIQINRKRV